MSESFFIVGGGSLQCRFIEGVKKCGYVTHVFDYDPLCPGKKIADNFHCISIDDKEKILEIAQDKNPIAIQTVATEAGNISCCYVGEKIGLNTNSHKTALDTTNKARMKEIFSNKSIPHPKTKILEKQEDLLKDYKFPLVVKPSDRSAGRGVKLVNNIKELKSAYQEALSFSNNKKILIEDYLIGDQYSVESISQNGKHIIVGITEEYVNGPPFFVEKQHLFPARINKQLKAQIIQLTTKTLDAFHIKNGASHLELKNTDKGLQIIEIASRMGGLRDELIYLATGIDYLKLLIDSVIGNDLSFEEKYQKFSIAKFILNPTDYKIYQTLKEKFDVVKNENINYKNKPFQAENLMQSQGYYYIQIKKNDDPNFFLNMS